jgi:hypothetical protein
MPARGVSMDRFLSDPLSLSLSHPAQTRRPGQLFTFTRLHDLGLHESPIPAVKVGCRICMALGKAVQSVKFGTLQKKSLFFPPLIEKREKD